MSQTGNEWATLKTVGGSVGAGFAVAASIHFIPPPWVYLLYALYLWLIINFIVLLAPGRCPVCGKWGTAPVSRTPEYKHRPIYTLRPVHRHDIIRTCPDHWMQVMLAARLANIRNGAAE